MYKLIILSIITGFISLTSCKDKDPTKPGVQRKAPAHEYYEVWMGEAKDYLLFKTGSWWVYKNVQSGLLDTLVCTLSKYDTVTATGNHGFRTIKYDYLRIVTKSKAYGSFYDFYSRGKNPDVVPSNTFIFQRDKTPQGGSHYPSFYYPFAKKDGPVSQFSLHQIAVDSTVIVNGSSYNNVQVFRIGADASYPDILYSNPSTATTYLYCFYAKKYGIIKYSNPLQSHEIELVEHHLIQ